MKKKILFIIPNLIGGGAIKTVANLSQNMQDKYHITVIALNKTEQSYKFGGEVVALENIPSKNPIKKILNYAKKIRFVKKCKKENQFDYSISFLTWADIVNTFSKTKHKEKTIISVRNIESIEYKNKFIKKIQTRVACKKADRIVSITKQVGDDLIENFGAEKEKVITIYNPSIIDNGELPIEEEKNKKLFENSKVFISVGNLKYQKGQWHLIRSFKKVVEKNPNAKLLILGEGDYREYLQKIINELYLENNVFLLGFTQNPYWYMKKSAVFVFPSMFEGLGNAIMEALSCEIPVISTDYDCGAREIIAPDTDYKNKTKDKAEYCKFGILVPVFNGKRYNATDELSPEEMIMAEAMNNLISNEELLKQYKEKSIERSKDFYIGNIKKKWEELLENM